MHIFVLANLLVSVFAGGKYESIYEGLSRGTQGICELPLYVESFETRAHESAQKNWKHIDSKDKNIPKLRVDLDYEDRLLQFSLDVMTEDETTAIAAFSESFLANLNGRITIEDVISPTDKISQHTITEVFGKHSYQTIEIADVFKFTTAGAFSTWKSSTNYDRHYIVLVYFQITYHNEYYELLRNHCPIRIPEHSRQIELLTRSEAETQPLPQIDLDSFVGVLQYDNETPFLVIHGIIRQSGRYQYERAGIIQCMEILEDEKTWNNLVGLDVLQSIHQDLRSLEGLLSNQSLVTIGAFSLALRTLDSPVSVLIPSKIVKMKEIRTVFYFLAKFPLLQLK